MSVLKYLQEQLVNEAARKEIIDVSQEEIDAWVRNYPNRLQAGKDKVGDMERFHYYDNGDHVLMYLPSRKFASVKRGVASPKVKKKSTRTVRPLADRVSTMKDPQLFKNLMNIMDRRLVNQGNARYYDSNQYDKDSTNHEILHGELVKRNKAKEFAKWVHDGNYKQWTFGSNSNTPIDEFIDRVVDREFFNFYNDNSWVEYFTWIP